MRPFTRLFRYAALGFALVQYLLAGGFAVLDGQIEAESNRISAVHIEDPGTACGVTHHSPDCAICHFLATGMGPATGVAIIPAGWTTTDQVGVVEPQFVLADQPDRHALPRAPPLLA